MANIMQMMQKAQKFKQKMQDLQDRVAQTDVGGAAAGGAVRCTLMGRTLKAIKIDPSLIKADEADVLEDLVVAAVNDALQKADTLMSDETQKLMQEMGLPPGMGLPF